MGSLVVVETKITSILKKTLTTNVPKRLSQTPSNRCPNPNNKTKHAHSFTRAYCSNAYNLFDEMPERNQKSAITCCYYNVFDLIKLSSVRPDILNVMVVHSLALKVGVLAYLPSSTSMLVSYSRAGHFRSSVDLFNEMNRKDVVAWNAIMSAAVEHQGYGDALDFFVKMIKEGNEFDSATLVIVVSVLSKMDKLINGYAVHGLSLKAGMISDPFLCNALINMYAKCGDLSSSECIFLTQECRDTVSWNSMISSCLYNDQPEKSLWYFKEMCCFEKVADNVNLSCAISACASLGELNVGRVIHGWGIKLGFEESLHVSIANSLISFYSKFGEIDSACDVFRGLLCKDVISWNSLIDGLASNGQIEEAFCCMYEMQLAGFVQPDTVTLLILLPLCAELSLSREGKAIHGFSIRKGNMGSKLSITNSLVYMYMQCNRVHEAEHLFRTMPERDLVTWNTMISGYSNNGYAIEAQNLFKKLLSWCSECSLSTILGILPSCNSPASLDLGKSIHGWQLKLGLQNNVLLLNSLMFMYINCGDLAACFSLLCRFGGVVDTACWNAVIAGCTQNGFYLDALKTFNSMMRESHVTHDSITLVSVISACGNLELVLEGKLSHGLSIKTLEGADIRVQNSLITMYAKFGDIHSAKSVFDVCAHRNLCSWNCIISALSQNKYANEALQLFLCLDLEPNEITIATILSACTQLGLMRRGKEIHGFVYRFQQFHRNSFVTAALIDMYSNCGRFETAIQVFQCSPEKSAAAWNSLISAYGFHSKGQEAIEVFNEMIESGTSPTKTTFVSLLSACSHVGLVNEGLWYYDRMVDEYDIQPVVEHHVCMVDLLGRAGRLNDAYDFIKETPSHAEPGLWGALLSACKYHGNIEMGRKVADVLFCLDPENAGYYISLSNMFVAAEIWSDAVKFRGIIEDKRLRKPAGYSLNIDIGLMF